MERQNLTDRLKSSLPSFWTQLTEGWKEVKQFGLDFLTSLVTNELTENDLIEAGLQPNDLPFTKQMIDEAPFIFEGNSKDKKYLKCLYLRFLQTSEGKHNVDMLKRNECIIKLKMANLSDSYGQYDVYSNQIVLASNRKSVHLIRTLRHETDHALDYMLPIMHQIEKNPTSVALLFFMHRMMELKTAVNDTMMAHKSNEGVVSTEFVQSQVQQARQKLPDTSDKDKKVDNFVRTEVAKAYWSGGANVSDPYFKDFIDDWICLYNKMVFRLVRADAIRASCHLSPKDDLYDGVQQLVKAMELPIDADFLINNVCLKGNQNQVDLTQNSIRLTEFELTPIETKGDTVFYESSWKSESSIDVFDGGFRCSEKGKEMDITKNYEYRRQSLPQMASKMPLSMILTLKNKRTK